MYLVTAQEMRTMDQETIHTFGIPGQVLMENAGRGATRMLLDRFPFVLEKKVGILAGRGNNGGDGFVIARYLAQYGAAVCVYLLSEKSRIKGDAEANLKLLDPLGVPVFEMPDKSAFDKLSVRLNHQEIWVDAILGTGLSSEVKGFFKDVIQYINYTGRPVFAVDIPSGLDSDTGNPLGIAVNADATATFGFAKIGHVTFPGKDYCGDIGVIDIGIPEHIVEQVGPKHCLLTPGDVMKTYVPRASDAHKGITGHLMIVAGSTGKTGAAAMAATSAVRVGAGLVTLGVPADLNAILETQVLEAMTVPLDDTGNGALAASAFDTVMGQLEDKRCLAIGPGIGMHDSTKTLVFKLLESAGVPVVIDADALNIVAEDVEILKKARGSLVLTPHPGEMARLAGTCTTKIQENRVAAAKAFAVKHHVHLVLKGAATVVAHPDGSIYINPTGNPGMASGGMGDVLTGMISGFLVQGYPLETAVHMGVFLHGAAADHLAEDMGSQGYLASDVMRRIPSQLQCLKQNGRMPDGRNKMPVLLGL